ncbi:ankyrin [Rhizoclosmatium globosum]|uniref:Ankyrin n=1 Tax=Rhizoclosmatium globosum TaxID=329046 RepID=A0A1Y2CR41_9FUNG|nr:ankyrin [Rhizoclosmatium globosum]|eukprot:ORY49427.1 ankyrin [Rhizoclosmatium globosum]
MVRLESNAFFAHFVKTSEFSLLKNSYARGDRQWILLVPQQSSLVGIDVGVAGFTAAHILVPTRDETTNTRHSLRRYRSLGLGSRRVDLGIGFLLVKDAFDSADVSQEVNILESVLYSENGVTFSILCISEPLSLPSPGILPPQEMHDSILSVARILGSVKNSRTNLTILDEINKEIDSFNDRVLEMQSLIAMGTEMKHTLDACFNIINKIEQKMLNAILEESDIQVETLYQLTETYVMENTYELTYFLISKELRQRDSEFAAAVISIESLDLVQLGISSRFGESLMRAVKEFSHISTLRTPFEKIKCLMKSIRLLNAKTTRRSSSPTRLNGDVVLSSDVLVPLLVLIVIRSNVQNLPSSLYYMQHFSFEHDVEGGEYGYALSSLEGVISYILTSSPGLAEVCAKNKELLGAIERSDVAALSSFMDASMNEVDESQRFLEIRSNVQGDGLLILACRVSSIDIVKLLLQKGLKATSQNYNLETSLHIAAVRGDSFILQLLLENNAKSSYDIFGYTPFLRCVENKHAGMTAFHLCRDEQTLSKLIELLGLSSINDRNNEGLTPLLHHCQRGNVDLVMALIQLPQVDYKAIDYAGRGVLHIAGFRGYTLIVEAVITRIEAESGTSAAFINALSVRGNTALHAAAEPGHFEVAKALIRGGAKAGVKNLEGKVAGDTAKEGEVREYLDSQVFLSRAKKEGIGKQGFKFSMSLKRLEEGSIFDVKRTLRDFEFFRQQILVEYPNVFLPTVTGIVAMDAPIASYTTILVRQLVNRLNEFLSYVLNHPSLMENILVWDFLSTQSLDKELDLRNAKQRSTDMLEMITSSFPPVVDGLEATQAKFTK